MAIAVSLWSPVTITDLMPLSLPETPAYVGSGVYIYGEAGPGRLLETWSIVDEVEIRKSERFHQERIKRDFPKILGRGFGPSVETFSLAGMGEVELERLSGDRTLGLSIDEMKGLASEFSHPDVQAARAQAGLSLDPTDVEQIGRAHV